MNFNRLSSFLSRLSAAWLAVLLALSCAASNAGTVPSDTASVKSDLTDTDLAALRAVLDQLAESFVSHDSVKIERLVIEAPSHVRPLIGAPDRARIVENVKREFSEAKYLDFKILEITRDRELSAQLRTIDGHLHSVDVRLQFQLIYSHDERSADARRVIQNDLQYDFLVWRTNKGALRIVNSSFFNNLGRHGGGLPILLANGLIVLMSVMALFLFWIWMASIALWMRPRHRFWRAFVLWTPPLGAMVFFFAYCLPRWLRREKFTGR